MSGTDQDISLEDIEAASERGTARALKRRAQRRLVFGVGFIVVLFVAGGIALSVVLGHTGVGKLQAAQNSNPPTSANAGQSTSPAPQQPAPSTATLSGETKTALNVKAAAQTAEACAKKGGNVSKCSLGLPAGVLFAANSLGYPGSIDLHQLDRGSGITYDIFWAKGTGELATCELPSLNQPSSICISTAPGTGNPGPVSGTWVPSQLTGP
jgi:hypothetical protein